MIIKLSSARGSQRSEGSPSRIRCRTSSGLSHRPRRNRRAFASQAPAPQPTRPLLALGDWSRNWSATRNGSRSSAEAAGRVIADEPADHGTMPSAPDQMVMTACQAERRRDLTPMIPPVASNSYPVTAAVRRPPPYRRPTPRLHANSSGKVACSSWICKARLEGDRVARSCEFRGPVEDRSQQGVLNDHKADAGPGRLPSRAALA